MRGSSRARALRRIAGLKASVGLEKLAVLRRVEALPFYMPSPSQDTELYSLLEHAFGK